MYKTEEPRLNETVSNIRTSVPPLDMNKIQIGKGHKRNQSINEETDLKNKVLEKVKKQEVAKKRKESMKKRRHTVADLQIDADQDMYSED